MKIPYDRSNEEHFLIGREQFHHQGYNPPIIAPEALFCGNIVTRERYGSSVSTALNGREQSRHPFAVILLVTSLWRLPSCFAAMLFCDDMVTRGATGHGQMCRRF